MNDPHSSRTQFDLQTRARSTLARSPYFLSRNLNVELHGEEFVLTGVVGTYYQKQLAQEALRRVEGVLRIRNEIEVQTPAIHALTRVGYGAHLTR